MSTATGAILHVHARAARGLRNVEILGLKQDPYLRLRARNQVFQTCVIKDGGSMASWNEHFQIPIPNVTEREFLFLTVLDHNTLSDDTEIGCAKLPLVDIPSQVYVGCFDIFDKHANKVGVVDLALRLERVCLPFGASTSTPAAPSAKPMPLFKPVPVANSSGSLYPQQQYKQQQQQEQQEQQEQEQEQKQEQEHRQQRAGFSSIAAPSSSNMPPQAFYVQRQQQQQQQQQHVSPPITYAPRPPTQVLHYPADNYNPAPSLFATGVAPYSSPSLTPQKHQEQLQYEYEVPERLYYASTPGRPFTPVPSAYLLGASPYGDRRGTSTPTSTGPFSPYRHEQQQQQQQQQLQQQQEQQQSVSFFVPKPLRVEGSSSCSSDENRQIRVEEEENSNGSALPPCWEERRMHDGRVFYLDHIRKVTTWTRPLALGDVPEYTA